MRERNAARYAAGMLPNYLKKVTISWGVDCSVESDVVNCCAHGVRVLIPPQSFSMVDMPEKNNVVKVYIPIDHVWITGMCIYVTDELDCSVSMGIYFYHPSEQNYLNNLLSNTLNVPPQADSFVCHEWEELVDKLCNSEDPTLKEIGYKEMEILKAKGAGHFQSDRP
jgi:hypothetical protein